MRRILLLIVIAVLAATPAAAQVNYEGNLYVTVSDEDGTAVSGADVSVTGPDYIRRQTTNAAGGARFIKLPPAAYEVQVSAVGFNTQIYPNIQIDTLANITFPVTLQKSDIVEEVVVTAETPLLDRRNSGTSTVLTQEEITQIPTARDPWAVLQTIPGVMGDRINVGGNEAGQQANFVGKGDDGEQSTWVMDGVDFTDNSAEGATSSYLDFNAFEQIGFVTGGADIEQSSPGLRLNFVQKQGSNQHTGTARMLYTEEGIQDTNDGNVTDPVTGASVDVTGNQITEIFEKNFDIGGPILKDRLWYWFGFTQNDINLLTTQGLADVTKLRNISGKVHGTEMGGALTYKAFYTEGDKIKDGRTAVPNRTAPTTWDQSGPSPIYSGSLSYFFTPNFEMSAQISKVDGGFALTPKAGSGPGTQIIVDENGTWLNTFIEYSTKRPTKQYAVRGNNFLSTGNWDHELKYGFKYRETDLVSISRYGGDGVLAFRGPGGVGGSATLYRDGVFGGDTEHTNLWVGNTMLNGPWAINYGLHYSSQEGTQTSSAAPANALLPCPTITAGSCDDGGIPALAFAGFDPGVKWDDVMVRAGATYTFDWERRLLLKASFGQYVDTYSNADVTYNNPVAVSGIGYGWDDLNDDLLVQSGELDTSTILFTTNFDPNDVTAVSSPDRIDTNLDAPRVTELLLGAEYELARNFTLGANITHRIRDRELYTPLVDLNTGGALASSYYDCSTIGTIAEGTFSESICALNAAAFADGAVDSSRASILTNDDSMEVEYTGLELTATKRLSDRWMLRGFFTYLNWEKSFSGTPLTNTSFDAPPSSRFVVPAGDPTNMAGDTAVDGSDVAYQAGGSGPTNDIWPGSARWTMNVNGLVQLPRDWQISGNLQAREGYAIPVMLVNGSGGLSVFDADGQITRKTVQIGSFGSDRYDDIFLVDLKAAKLFRLGGATTVETALEVFNAFNDDTVLASGRSLNGGQASVGTVSQIVSPRVYRLSATINF